MFYAPLLLPSNPKRGILDSGVIGGGGYHVMSRLDRLWRALSLIKGAACTFISLLLSLVGAIYRSATHLKKWYLRALLIILQLLQS
jgi:hypothetical protein